MLTRGRLLLYTAFTVARQASRTPAHSLDPSNESHGSKLHGMTSAEAKGWLDMREQRNLVTVPMIVEGNVPIVELEFQAAAGAVRKARFMIDTGG